MRFVTPQMAWNYDVESINSIDFNPTREELVVCGSDSSGENTFMRFWSIQKENIFKNHQKSPFATVKSEINMGHTKAINVCRFSPSGRFLATGSDDNKIIIWKEKIRPKFFGSSENVISWGEANLLIGHTKEIYHLEWFRDEKFLLSGSHDYTVIVWDILKSRIHQRFDGANSYIKAVCVDPLGKYFCAQSCDRMLRIYQRTKNKKNEFFTKSVVNRVKFDNKINLEEEGEEQKIFLHESCIENFFRRMEFSPDGTFFIAPGGEYKNFEKNEKTFCAYAFARKNLSKPVLAFPSEKPVILVKFCPTIFKLKSGFSLFDTKTKVVFVLATTDSIAIYASDSITPLYYIKKIHFASLTDLAFYGSQILAVSSMDGYITFVEFEENQFGSVHTDFQQKIEPEEENLDKKSQKEMVSTDIPKIESKQKILFKNGVKTIIPKRIEDN
jgi:chromatin assembly factor 1 subunit B